MKKLALVLALCMVFSIVLAGCSSDQEQSSTPDGQSSTDNETGKRTDLRLALQEIPSVLDPHYANMTVEQWIAAQIYEPLYFIEDDGTEVPTLATDYTISDDGLTWTFTLREGVQFHNGEPLKASDVVYTIERCRGAARMYSYVEPIADVTAPDDNTVVFTLGYEYAPFLNYIGSLMIVNEKYCTEVGEEGMRTSTCGTGPYVLKEHNQNIETTLQANPNYWREEAPIKDISFKIITDTSTMLIAFESGELDCVTVPSPNWEAIQATGKYTTVLNDAIHVSYLMMNHIVEPFDNKLVRQAVNYALNKDDMVLMAMDGLAAPAMTLAKPGYVFGATEDCPTYPYDPDKARELLNQAGFPDGFDAGAIKTISGYFEKIAQVAQSNLADVGITATIEVCESSAYNDDCIGGNFSLAVMGVTVGTDMANYDMIYHTKYIDNLNCARYSNPEVDALFDEGVATVDKAEREQIYKELISIVQEDAVYAPVFFRQSPVAYDPGLNATFYLSQNLYYEWSWKE